MFVESINGVKTPKDIAKSLKKYGNLLAVFPDPIFCGERKYYSIKEESKEEKIAEVLYMGGEAVTVTFLPKETKKAILMHKKKKSQQEINFGGF